LAKQIYTIYCHEDTDGGVAAAIYAQTILERYKQFGWDIEISPVNHGVPADDWSCREISYPCAILDFSLHSQFLNERFFMRSTAWAKKLGGAHLVPRCAWIDHHPTGASFSILTPENITKSIPNALVKWDTHSISTPGLMRTWHEELNIPRAIIERYEEYVDLAEIVDGALFATAESAHDFSTPAVWLQALFSTEHPAVNRTSLFRKIVRDLMADPNPERLLEKDVLYSALVQHERDLHAQRVQAYAQHSRLIGNTLITDFMNANMFCGMGRFIPYLLYPDITYAIHVLPKSRGVSSISCGINPWKKPSGPEKHLGNYFAEHFQGGGHSFVAGGRVQESETRSIDLLAEFLQA
jgi:hypothetical protein